MLRRLVFGCCVVAIAGFAAATSFSPDAGSSATASPALDTAGSLVGVVASVVDGDTLVVRFPSGKRERIRVLGIDSPEMRPRERCAVKATEAARRLAQGKTVALVGDRTQATRDRYKRLLAYTMLPDGSDLGRRMVATGYATVYVVGGRPFLRAGSYRAAEKSARAKRFGLWRTCSTRMPDAGPIVFSARPDAPGAFGWQLFVAGADGRDVRRLTTVDGDGSPSWSPDGSQVVFERFIRNACDEPACSQIWIVNADGSQPEPITPRRLAPRRRTGRRTAIVSPTSNGDKTVAERSSKPISTSSA